MCRYIDTCNYLFMSCCFDIITASRPCQSSSYCPHETSASEERIVRYRHVGEVKDVC